MIRLPALRPSLRALLLAALLLALLTRAWPARAGQRLPPVVQAEMARVGLSADDIALVALPLDGGFGWQHRPDVPMQPGSAMKLVTSVVALDRLGPLQRGHTDLLATAPVEAGVLRGDLFLRGGADPELGLPQLWAMLLELREQGIETIDGRLVVDRTLFRPLRPELGVPPFDETPEFPYNVIPDALHLAGGLMGVYIESDARDVRARAWPRLDGIEVDSAMVVSPGRACADWSGDWQRPAVAELGDGAQVLLRGPFPPDCKVWQALQLVDRQRLVDAGVRTLWRQLGGRGPAATVEGATPGGARVLATHRAPPWFQLLRQQNKSSDNALSRLLFLQLGVPGMQAQPGLDTAVLAADVVRGWFDEHGIDSAGLVLDNGSGLSRHERISARQLAQMLKVARQRPNAADLLASLPLAGRDGTMRRRLRDSPAAGQARLKTGTLRNAAALAGYVSDRTGREWALAAIVNHDEHALASRAVLDAWVDWFAREWPWSHGGEPP